MIKLSRAVSAAAAVLAVGGGSLTWAVTSASASTERSVVHVGSAAPAVNVAPAVKSAVIPRCSPGQLAVWVDADNTDATAGTRYYHLEFTNTGRTTCHLYSWPGVSARNLAGKQL